MKCASLHLPAPACICIEKTRQVDILAGPAHLHGSKLNHCSNAMKCNPIMVKHKPYLQVVSFYAKFQYYIGFTLPETHLHRSLNKASSAAEQPIFMAELISGEHGLVLHA